jgi:hypothetical protein
MVMPSIFGSALYHYPAWESPRTIDPHPLNQSVNDAASGNASGPVGPLAASDVCASSSAAIVEQFCDTTKEWVAFKKCVGKAMVGDRPTGGFA